MKLCGEAEVKFLVNTDSSCQGRFQIVRRIDFSVEKLPGSLGLVDNMDWFLSLLMPESRDVDLSITK